MIVFYPNVVKSLSRSCFRWIGFSRVGFRIPSITTVKHVD